MPELLFDATGPNFTVDAFLAESPWREWADVFRRGEPTHTTSGFTLTLADGGSLEEQLAEALAFFADDRDELQRLAAFPNVTKLELRFGFFWWRDSLGQFYSLPPAFMQRTSELGVTVTLCVYGVDQKRPS